MAYFNGNHIVFGFRQTQSVIENIVHGEASGSSIVVDDVSPVEHDLDVTVASKNLLPYDTLSSTTLHGVTCTNNQDGSYVLSGTGTSETGTGFSYLIYALPVVAGVQYVLSGCPIGGSTSSYYMRAISATVGVDVRDTGNGVSFTPSADGTVNVRIYAVGGYTYNNLIFYPMVEIGNTATEYTPYVDVEGVKVTRTGKNLLPYPYYHTTRTNAGITFTDNGDGTITANGTATADASAYFNFSHNVAPMTLVVGGKYTLSGCPEGGSTSTYQIVIRDVGGTNYKYDRGNGVQFTANENTCYAYIVIYKGVTVENLVFKPMLELGETATEYEQYKEPQIMLSNADGSVVGLESLHPSVALQMEYGTIKTGEVLEKLYFDTGANIDSYLASLTYMTSGSYAGACQLITNSAFSTVLMASDLGLSTGGGTKGYTLSIAHLSSGTVKSITTVYSSVKFDLSSYYSGYKADKVGWQTDSIDFAMTVSTIASEFSPINGTVIKDRPHGVIMNLKYHQDANIVIARLKEQLKAVAVTIPLEDESEV